MIDLPEKNHKATYNKVTMPEFFHNFDQQQPDLVVPDSLEQWKNPREGENQGEKYEEKEKEQVKENQETEKVEENVEKAGKVKRPKGEQLEFKIRAGSSGRCKLEKVMQQLVEEQLQALQLNVFDRNLQELRERVEKIECENKHQQILNRLQTKTTRLARKFTQASESIRKMQEIGFPPSDTHPRSTPTTSSSSTFCDSEAAQWSALPQSPANSVIMKEEVENFKPWRTTLAERTTLVHSEDEAVFLKPDDITLPDAVGKTEANTKSGRLIVDHVTKLSGVVIRTQLRDCSDIVTCLYLAPPTKKSMLWMETGRVDELFSLPAHPLWNSRLRKTFTRCLTPPVPRDLRKRSESSEDESPDEQLEELDNREVPAEEATSRQRDATDRAQLAQVSTMETGKSAPEEPSISPPSTSQGVKRKAHDTETTQPMNDLTILVPNKDTVVNIERCEVENTYLRTQLEDQCSRIRHLTEELKRFRESEPIHPAGPQTANPPDPSATSLPHSTQPEVPPSRHHARLSSTTTFTSCSTSNTIIVKELARTPCLPELPSKSAGSWVPELSALPNIPLRAVPKDLDASLYLLSKGHPDRYARLLFQNFITFKKYREWSKSVNWDGSCRKVGLPYNLKESILKMVAHRFPRVDLTDIMNIRNRINECLRTPRRSFRSKSTRRNNARR
ncbi:hypothetical protein AAFF_G00402930 [Aldrovandia affinis]|uniref:ATF7-interacting protein protein binding domain-containing protein n=1 Tax=Aldrovandia affinis TaxID=143900 RepID=A0AAD7WZR2_9TELE|nr:hypothetical protein AAFF_G00402930 [Aldrovandia affinis]